MTTYETHGFLSDQASLQAAKVELENPELFRCCKDIAQLAHQSRFKITSESDNIQHLLVALLFGKALKCFEATVILSRLGMENESDSVLRSLAECTYSAAAADKDFDTACDIVRSAEHTRIKLLRLANKHLASVDSAEELKRIENLIGKIRTRVKTEGIPEMKIRTIAERADMLGDYETSYAILCLSAHPDARRLQDSLRTDESGNVKGISWAPIYSSLYSRLSLAIDCLARILQCSALNLDKDVSIRAIAFRKMALNFLKFQEQKDRRS